MTRGKWILVVIIAIIVAFLAGFVWQYLEARSYELMLADTQSELRLQRLESTLAAATVEALTGNYEVGRQLASRFYTDLQGRVSEPTPAAAELRQILDRRDATITLLSRGDPRSGEELTSQLVRYRVAVGGPEQALPVGGPEEALPAGVPASAPADSTGAAPATPDTSIPSSQPAPTPSDTGGLSGGAPLWR